jgi:hypothetical protein
MNLGVQEFRSAEVQEFRSAGVQESVVAVSGMSVAKFPKPAADT